MHIAKIVIATHNPAKKERFRQILGSIADTILDLDDVGVTEKPTETGETAEVNAEIKACFYAKKLGLPVFCEDESLYADFLPQEMQPGVHVRRINGIDEADDDQLLAHWKIIIENIIQGKRTGKWHIAYCVAMPNGTIKTMALDHPILFFSPPSPIRKPGWPLSSLEGPQEFGKPESELTDEEIKQHTQRVGMLIAEKAIELL